MIYKNQNLISMEQLRVEEKKAKDRQMFIDGIKRYIYIYIYIWMYIYTYLYIYV
jgi:hypothetical protein